MDNKLILFSYCKLFLKQLPNNVVVFRIPRKRKTFAETFVATYFKKPLKLFADAKKQQQQNKTDNINNSISNNDDNSGM